jgi:hypothetical protein
MRKGQFIEVVGLWEGNNGRHCILHPECCGKDLVQINTLLLIKPTIVLNKDGQNEYALAAIHMKEGIESSTVGFNTVKKIGIHFKCF